MRHVSILSAGLACLCALAASGDALARPRHHHRAYGYYAEGRRPLVVERRSFLDPGTKVPVGRTNNYMLQQTYFNEDPIRANQRSWYQGEVLPRHNGQPYGDDLLFEFP